MRVDMVRGLPALQRLRGDWRRLYAADPEGQFFLSWPWMSAHLAHQSEWCVLVARPAEGAPPVALFPIRKRTHRSRRGQPRHELSMPGRGAADYTGFLCRPRHQEQAGRAFAEYLLEREWEALSLDCLRASPSRMHGFFQAFAAAPFAIERRSLVMSSGIDNAICPYADLPGDWDRYLAGRSGNTRQRLRRLLRLVDQGTLHVTHTDAGTWDRDVGILLRLWTARWGAEKGDHLGAILASTRRELRDAVANGTLSLLVLWRGDAAIAAITCMLDFEKREVLFQLGARDQGVEELSPGVLLHAYAIRSAIERGFVRYDFLRGNEPYKYSFATAERRIESIVLRRVGGAALGHHRQAAE